MPEYHFSLGAHLLMWAFPLALVALALALHFSSSGRTGEGS